MHVLAIFVTVFLSAHAIFKNEPHITKLRKEHKHHHSVWEFVEKDENNTDPRAVQGRSIGIPGGSTQDHPRNDSNYVTLKIGHKRIKISEAKLSQLTVHDLEELEKLELKLEKLNKHFANYSNIEINETLVKQYSEHHTGKLHMHGRGVHRGPIKLGRGLPVMGRGVPSSVGRSAGAGTAQKSNETAAEGGLDIGGDDLDDVEEFKKYPVREWGDECTITEDDDECFDYTKNAFPGDNKKHLSCDSYDRICLCLQNSQNIRAEYSKEKQFCLLPRYYRCDNTTECAPLLECEPATARDYANDGEIPKGNPKICRLKVTLNNVADQWKVSLKRRIAYFLLIIMMQV